MYGNKNQTQLTLVWQVKFRNQKQNKTKQNKTVMMKNITKLAWLLKFILIHTVRASAITLRSTAASSSWRSLVIAVKQASGTTSAALRVKKLELALISFPMYWVEGHISHCSQVSRRCHPEWSLCFGEFGWSSLIKHPPWTAFLLVMGKNLRVFYESQFCRVSISISLSDFVRD